MKILLVGAPNSGKTTLFNSLTGKSEKSGNWHGVTVENKSAFLSLGKNKIEVVDTPGIYSLKTAENEEKNAADEISRLLYDKIIVVTEAKKINRAVRFIDELQSVDKPIILFINLYGDFLKRGGVLDVEKLAARTGAKVIVGEATSKKDADKLKNAVAVAQRKNPDKTADFRFRQPSIGKLSNSTRRQRLFVLTAFASTILFVLFFAFSDFFPISRISEAISRLLNEKVAKRVYRALEKDNLFLARLLSEGAISAIASVLAFLPQIALVFLATEFLAQSGILSFASAYSDAFFKRFALNGKCVYCLSCGYGCSALAITSARGIDDEKARKRLILSIPFVSCSAKTPVYFFIAKTIFPKQAFFAVSSIFIASFFIPLAVSAILQKTAVKEEPRVLINELADLKIPLPSVLLKSLLKTLKEFIIKLGSIVFTATVAAWLALNVSPKIQLLTPDEWEYSILARVGKTFEFLFSPINLDRRFSAAAISGLFAKESVASVLACCFPNGLAMTASQGAAFMTFCYFSPPCVVALSAMKKQLGFKTTAKSFLIQLTVALVSSYAIYYILELILELIL